VNAVEKLAKNIANYDNQLRNNTIDLPAPLETGVADARR
jgi:hypothetical protein